jgi:hypothetical protein
VCSSDLTNRYQSIDLPVQMRALPTIGTVAVETGTGATFSNASTASVTVAPSFIYQATNHSAVAIASIPLSAEI